MLFSLSAIAHGDNARVDYNHHADFKAFHSYCWKNISVSNPLNEHRIRRAVDQELQKRGWREDNTNCQVAVMATDKVHTEKQAETYYDGLGGGWGWGGWGWGPDGGFGTSTTQERDVQQNRLVVDLFDTKNKSLVWRGVLHQTLTRNGQTNRNHTYAGIHYMFRDFPPKS